MTTAITSSTIESKAYDNIISYLDDRSIIADPRSSTKSRKFIYDTDPLMKAVNFGDYPYIIAEFPTVEYSNLSTDGKTKNIIWRMNITVRTAREGSGQSSSGQGKTDMFSICDDLQSFFNNDTYKRQFQNLNMFFMTLTKESVDSIIVSQSYLYESRYSLSFMTRLQVST